MRFVRRCTIWSLLFRIHIRFIAAGKPYSWRCFCTILAEILLDLRTVAAGNESGLSQVSVAPYFPALLAFANCASAYLENFEIAHIGSEDFEIRHIACEAMI